MDPQLKGKAALITGGSSGIGLAIAHALADEGVDVAVAARTFESDIADSLQAKGVRVYTVHADVSHEDDVVRMVRETVDEFGRLDFFVNNAARAMHQPLTKIDTQAYRTVVDTNLSACLWGCREVSQHFISQRIEGSILVVGSTSMYTPGPSEAVYRISKVGLQSLVQTMAVELAPHRIRVNLLVPGHYRTRLTEGVSAENEAQLKQQIPMRRFGDAADCGNAAAFLLSPVLARYVTGAELIVDGGLSLRPLYFGTDEELKELNRVT